MNPESAAQIVSTERKLFAERRNQFADQLAADQSSIDQLQSQREALAARRLSSIEQSKVMRFDYDSYQALQAKQLVTKSVVNDAPIAALEFWAEASTPLSGTRPTGSGRIVYVGSGTRFGAGIRSASTRSGSRCIMSEVSATPACSASHPGKSPLKASFS